MKANELMIGDFVKVNINNHCEFGGVWVDLPIQLTPEILEKNKFINHHGEYYCTVEKQLAGDGFELMTITYIESKNRIQILTSTSNIETVCKHVHELQHLIRFCGIEKTIEL